MSTPKSNLARPLRRALRLLEYTCWLCGGFLLAWVGFTLWSVQNYQHALAASLTHLERNMIRERILHNGDLLGRISIPRLGISSVVVEGVDDKNLRLAVGHFPESSVPEKAGTVALAGHRDTFFRSLGRIHEHDLITLETPSKKYLYEVVHTAIVNPKDTDVIRSSSESDLTLVTCYPFHYIGRAPQRFIVQALLVRPH